MRRELIPCASKGEMGANLIGCLLKGPYDLPEEKRAEAILCAKATMLLLRQAAQDYAAEKPLAAEAEELLEEYQIDPDYELDGYDVDDESLARMAEVAVADLYNVWNNNNARDMHCRTDPDDATQLLFFCGELSHGDSPQGYAYETITDAAKLGLLKFFNIR